MKKKTVITGLVLCLILAIAQPVNVEAMSKALTSESIRDKQEQLSEAEKEKTGLQSNLTDLKKLKKELETKKKDLNSYVAQLDSSLTEIEQKITELKTRITSKEEEIIQKEAELADAQENEDFQKESMIAHIRLMYEKGTPSMLDMLLGAKSFGDFLNKADYVECVMNYDQQMWEDYIAIREFTELCKEELELEKEILDQTKANVEIEQQNLEELLAQKMEDLSAYENDISDKERAIREYEELIAAQDAEIEALEAAIAEEKKQQMQENGISYDGGSFKFPIASYTRLSSDYGWRMHPTLHVEKFHNGIDLAAPKGTAIYAAYDGKVVAATYSATMGNYVMIDHGDSLYTIYMHASALYVSKGDIVVRGETIAAVGTTGRSTGNHLHFGVRKNGAYQSPWDYIKKP